MTVKRRAARRQQSCLGTVQADIASIFLLEERSAVDTRAARQILEFGEVTEWFKVLVLKTSVGQLTASSNLALSARNK